MPSSTRRMRTSLAIQESAEVLWKQPTPAEALLWQNLRSRRLAGLKFRRQHPSGPYVADFCCAEQRLVVELDGPVHAEQVEADKVRTAYLEAQGYRVMRFLNRDVFDDLPVVLSSIRRAACGAA